MTFEILPVKKPKIKDDIDVPEPLMKPPFCALLVAGVHSGKSNVLINLIYRAYSKDIFTGGIIFFSPNIYNDDIFENNLIVDDDIKKIDQNLDQVDEYVKEIVKQQGDIPKKDREHILLIFDDCLGYVKHNSFTAKFCTRYRQLKISLIFTTQVFRAMPNTIRANATFILLFKTYNEDELKKIAEEMGHIPNFLEHFHTATDEKYSFLYVDLRNMRLYKRFEHLLWSKY